MQQSAMQPGRLNCRCSRPSASLGISLNPDPSVCNSAHKCIQEWRILNKVNIFLDRDEIRVNGVNADETLHPLTSPCLQADLEKLEKSLELVAQNFSVSRISR